MSSEQPIPTRTHQPGPRSLVGRGPGRLRHAHIELTAPLLRRLERKAREYRRRFAERPLPLRHLASVTAASFALEHLSISEPDVIAALHRRNGLQPVRSVQILRTRNHVAILRAIERITRLRIDLAPAAVIRWYTSIACGLSIGHLEAARFDRLALHLRRINATPLRLPQAIPEAAAVYSAMIADPIFPGFNGLLTRLLLQYHLLRCALPPVVLTTHTLSPTHLLEAIEQAAERMEDEV